MIYEKSNPTKSGTHKVRRVAVYYHKNQMNTNLCKIPNILKYKCRGLKDADAVTH